MKKLEYQICLGIGDNLVIRIYFDSIKHNYDEIRISHNKHVLNVYRGNDPAYCKFLNELGRLLFSESPYIFDEGNYPEIQRVETIHNLANLPRKPDLDKQLCIGESLNLSEEYIVLTTKIRCLSKQTYHAIKNEFWNHIQLLSTKYKIVILGERIVEESAEYIEQKNTIFGIYDDAMKYIPCNRIIDLSVPALGITCPELIKIKNDCLIMKEAKCVLVLGIGGNFWLSAAVANTLCFRTDDDTTIDLIANSKNYPTVFATKNWKQFVAKLQEY